MREQGIGIRTLRGAGAGLPRDYRHGLRVIAGCVGRGRGAQDHVQPGGRLDGV